MMITLADFDGSEWPLRETRSWLWKIGVTTSVLVAVSAGYQVYSANQKAQQAQWKTAQQLMGLTTLGGTVSPGFQLTDQNGKTISLSLLKGKVVVLDFMDPHCTDICPIVSQELLDANRDLGQDASQVVFVGINVNRYYNAVADVRDFSTAQGLIKLSNWHFLTGDFESLQTAWRDYGVWVNQPVRNGDVQHGSLMYFIDRNGKEQYLANPTNTKSTMAAWGKEIAFVAQSLE